MVTMKKISLKFIMAITLFGLLSSCNANANDNKGTKDYEATQIVEQMQFGWNLGNTLDATGGSWARGLSTETAWGQPKTTKPMIDGLAKSGIKTIRIPISWHDHVIDKNYTIDPAWMARVKQIVDWAYENELFIIINTHHDNYDKNAPIPAGSGYYYPSQENYEESSNYLKALWTQICETFNNDYDYHLIFETMNEPRPCGTDYEWWHDPNSIFSKKFMGALNKLNQDVVDTIRKSGGNNKYRMIMVPALAASPDAATTMDFIMPKDTVENRLAVSVHMYTPYNFAMASPGDIKFTDAHKKDLTRVFSKLNRRFVSKGIPVVVGEMGATNKDNLQDRIAWFDYFVTEGRKNGIMTCCLWDNGVWKINKGEKESSRYSEHYGYYNRNEQTWFFPELHQTAIKAMKK